MAKITYTIEAIITLFPAQEGGRTTGIYSGYRPSFGFNTEKQYSGEIRLLGRKELQPGQTAKATMRLLPARTIRKNLKPSHSFTILEGNKVVGLGVIQAMDSIAIATI